MPDPTDISAELPAPRDDEPEALRSDIVDELTDHLNCAYQREVHSKDVADPRAVEQCVLDRFGNPARVARRLWWDAMKERIVSQRIMTAALVVLAVAGAGMFLATWQTLGSVRTYLADSQELNAALVEKLESLSSTAPAEVTNYDWCKLRLKLVIDAPDGPPAAGLTTTLQKLAGGVQTDIGKSYPYTTQESDENGMADYSPVPYGSYYVTVQTDEGHLLKKEIVIRPGNDLDLTIVCPHQIPTGDVALTVSHEGVTLPESIEGEVWTLCRIYQQNFFLWGQSVGMASDLEYGGTMLGDDRWLLWEYETVLASPDGELFAVEWPSKPFVVPEGGAPGIWPQYQLDEKFSIAKELTPLANLTLPVGQYTTDAELVVLQPTPEEGQAKTWRVLNDEERAAVTFESATDGSGLVTLVPSNPLTINAQSIAEWSFELSTLQTLCTDGVIAIIDRPRPENLSQYGPAGTVIGGGGFGGGGGFAGGGSGFF